MSENLKITTKGILKTLAGETPQSAIAEYIWNGFDASATIVEVRAVPATEGFESLSHVTIRDNGSGIPYGELRGKFSLFLESQKAARRSPLQNSNLRGEEGKGRLTFYAIANEAKWETVYVEKGNRLEYVITINSDALDKFDPTEPKPVSKPNGTIVTLNGIKQDFTMHHIKTVVLEYLAKEFGWYLKLNERNDKRILINGEPLDYQSTIADAVSKVVTHSDTGISFQIDFLQWKQRLDEEYSKVYFLDGGHREKFKKNTRFNNKGDAFYHSVYVTSPLFEGLVTPSDFVTENEEEDNNASLGFQTTQRKAYSFLWEQVEDLIRQKRRLFLKRSSEAFLRQLYDENVVPKFKNTDYDRVRKKDFENVVKTVYETEPRFFTELSGGQRKTFLGFLNLLLDSDERDGVLEILDEVLKLSADDRAELCAVLKYARLNHIIGLLKLIKDRFQAVELIKEFVFNYDLRANEVNDLQAAIEHHYWLFGEELHLVTAAEPKFEEALRRFHYILFGDSSPKTIEHKDRTREMDIFAVRQHISRKSIDSVIVELKHPTITLGQKELGQVKRYMNVILKEPQFNASNGDWRFYLVGNDYDELVANDIASSAHLGELGLVQRVGNCRIYVRKWSEVFNAFEVGHKHLQEKLLLERKKIAADVPRKKEEIAAKLAENTAKRPAESDTPVIPKH